MSERENENLLDDGADTQAIGGLMQRLPKVEAPKNFDLTLRSRIAGRKSSYGRRRSLVWYMVPTGLLLLVGAVFVWNALYSISGEPVAVADQDLHPAATVASQPASSAADAAKDEVPRPVEPFVPERRVAQVRKSAVTSARPRAVKPEPGGGSYDVGLGIQKPIYTRGIDPKKTSPDTSVLPGDDGVKSVLKTVGIEGTPNAGKWIVDSVTAGSRSERSGVRKGDVIEVLDSRPAAGSTRLPVELRSIGVRRDGKPLKLVLKP